MDDRNYSKAKEFMMKSLTEKTRETGAREDKTKRLTIDIPARLHKQLKIQAVTDGVTMAEIVRQLLVQQLVQNDGSRQ
jgi:predicted HicB family RNase H-like nuclease